MSASKKILSCGLPASGKTTYLAALWHLVSEREIESALSFESLGTGDNSHLNRIAERWRNAKPQERTELGAEHILSINLKDKKEISVQLDFPDLSGESFRAMWEQRECDAKFSEIVSGRDLILLFIHADKVTAPRWIRDEVEDMRALGVGDEPQNPPGQAEAEIPWGPQMAPTQVILVDLLQMLASPPINSAPQRIAVILSAWDKMESEGRSPEQFVTEKLTLLSQYLNNSPNIAAWKPYGISAQGGDFNSETERILEENTPSKRIRVIEKTNNSHDLTEPLRWLMQ